MAPQHSPPVLVVPGKTEALRRLGNAHLEAELQALVHAHPEALPIAEIDQQFVGALAICRELQLAGAGAVDNFLITQNGLPVLVECKLWRNPEARREVVGQILDYAKVLSRWSVADLEREVRARTDAPNPAGKNQHEVTSSERTQAPSPYAATLDCMGMSDGATTPSPYTGRRRTCGSGPSAGPASCSRCWPGRNRKNAHEPAVSPSLLRPMT